MAEEFRTLRVVREDILRILAENGEVSLDFVKEEVGAPSYLVLEALEELGKENLIQVEGGFAKLTETGQERSKDILQKHLVLENYFKKTSNERIAHKKAHVLEHYISEEVIRNVERLHMLKKKGIPLTEFGLDKEGLISDINLLDTGLFERIVSMGMLPGEKVEVTNVSPSYVVIKVKNKKFALGNDIAKGIRVIEREGP